MMQVFDENATHLTRSNIKSTKRGLSIATDHNSVNITKSKAHSDKHSATPALFRRPALGNITNKFDATPSLSLPGGKGSSTKSFLPVVTSVKGKETGARGREGVPGGRGEADSKRQLTFEVLEDDASNPPASNEEADIETCSRRRCTSPPIVVAAADGGDIDLDSIFSSKNERVSRQGALGVNDIVVIPLERVDCAPPSSSGGLSPSLAPPSVPSFDSMNIDVDIDIDFDFDFDETDSEGEADSEEDKH